METDYGRQGCLLKRAIAGDVELQKYVARRKIRTLRRLLVTPPRHPAPPGLVAFLAERKQARIFAVRDPDLRKFLALEPDNELLDFCERNAVSSLPELRGFHDKPLAISKRLDIRSQESSEDEDEDTGDEQDTIEIRKFAERWVRSNRGFHQYVENLEKTRQERDEQEPEEGELD